MWTVDRKESMSPDGFIRVIVQEDGDACLTVGQGEVNAGILRVASVEFCTPMGGGGGSSRTHAALRLLAVAMARDNAEGLQDGRRGEFPGTEILDDSGFNHFVEQLKR